jgi:hypothetical protein
MMEVINPKDPIQVPYCGPKNMKPLIAYTPFKDFNVGDFVLVRPLDLDLVPFWMGRVEGDVIKDEKMNILKW